ncbi:MAG: hypothetical protein ABJA78_07785 [Ferruginibacter sp.]
MKQVFFTLVTVILFLNLSQAQTWNGSAGTNWNVAANWTPANVPGWASSVIIGNTVNKPALDSNVRVTNLDMTAGSALNFNGFTLTTSGTFDVRGATLNNTNGATDIVITIGIAGGSGSNYFGVNIINDNITVSNNGNGPLYEGYTNGNIYNGNAIFNYNGTGTNYICYNQKSTFNGNLTINRTVAGTSNIFYIGFNTIAGNFSYNNTAGGASYIGRTSNTKGIINGTVNITANGAGNSAFELFDVTNLTSGGVISVQNPGSIDVEDDTLKSSLSITGLSGSSPDYVRRTSITGDFTLSDAVANTNSLYMDGITINGNTNYTFNSAINSYEGYLNGCFYNGNTNMNIAGTGTFFTSYQQKSTYNGNLTINRTVAGISNIFYTGFNSVIGNFSYTNTAGGNSFIGRISNSKGIINGTVNITTNGTGNPAFELFDVTNLTPGGVISVQNPGSMDIEDDTLKSSLSVTGLSGSAPDYIRRNSIAADLTLSDAVTNTNSLYVDGNIVTGNTDYTSNAAISWYESYANSCTYKGNIIFTRNAGTINFAYNDTTYVNQNLAFNSASGIDVNSAIQFDGSAYSAIEQLGVQPIVMPRLIMNKTGTGNVTLNDSVTITTGASFISGNIYSSTANNLIFPNNISYTGGSAASHVIGPVTKIGDDVFTFPLGGPASYNPVTMSAPAGVTSRFRAEYKNQNPTIDGYNTSTKAGSFGSALISNAGYWDVQRISGVTNVTLTFGFNGNPYEQYPVLANLKVAHWNGTQWDDHGNGGTTGTSANGTVVNSTAITSFSPFTIAAVIPSYFFSFGQPGSGPDGNPLKLKGIGGWPGYMVKQLPAGSYTADSIFLVPNGSTTSFRLKDIYGVEKDTTVTVTAAPTNYITVNGNATKNFAGWRHFVYMTDGGNNIMGAIRDNDLTLGNTTMNTYFSTANVATAPNGNIYLKRSFKITTQFAPVGTKRVRFYISKTEYNNLVAADPASFPNGINSLTITKYTGPLEDSLFNPIPGGNAIIIPNSSITIADLGTMYSLDVDVTGFSGFYIGGNQSNLSLCAGSSISIPSNVIGASYQWQLDNGSGYANISNGGIYNGVTSNILTLSSVPSNMYGYKLRAVVNGVTFSQEYTLKFIATWQGNVSNAWENTANWNCGILPDANTDVMINVGKPNYPQLGANASVRTLKTAAGTAVTVKSGFNLTIIK